MSRAGFNSSPFPFRWIAQLADSFATSGFQVLDSLRLPTTDPFRKSITELSLMAIESARRAASQQDGEAADSYRAFQETFDQAVLETQQGVSIGLDMLIVLGRKPLRCD